MQSRAHRGETPVGGIRGRRSVRLFQSSPYARRTQCIFCLLDLSELHSLRSSCGPEPWCTVCIIPNGRGRSKSIRLCSGRGPRHVASGFRWGCVRSGPTGDESVGAKGRVGSTCGGDQTAFPKRGTRTFGDAGTDEVARDICRCLSYEDEPLVRARTCASRKVATDWSAFSFAESSSAPTRLVIPFTMWHVVPCWAAT